MLEEKAGYPVGGRGLPNLFRTANAVGRQLISMSSRGRVGAGRKTAAIGAAGTAGAAYLLSGKKRKFTPVPTTKSQPDIVQPVRVQTRSKSKRKRKKGRTRNRKMRKLIKSEIYKTSNMGRELQQVYKNNTVLSVAANEAKYFNFNVGRTNELIDMMDNEYIIQGLTTGGTQRDEIINLAGTTTNNNWKLMYNGTLTVELKNNYNYALELTVYWCSPKFQTDVAPETEVEAGLDQRLTDISGELSTCWYARHSPRFVANYKTHKINQYLILPGEGMTLFTKTGWRVFEPENQQEHSSVYRRNLTQLLLMRMQGTVSHDNEKTGVGYSEAKLDVIHTRKYKFKHMGQHQVGRWKQNVSLDALPVQYVNPNNTDTETAL